MKKYLLSMLLALLIPFGAVAQEAYAVYNNGTLTFYYDNLKSSRSGTKYALNTGTNYPSWYSNRTSITKVVFDASFTGARPTTTYRWFNACSNLTEIEGISNLKTDNVTDMFAMFWGCSGLNSLDLSSFDTSNVTNMKDMFCSCSNLTSLDVSSFDTGKVTDMCGVFGSCSGLTSLDVSNFDTGNTKYMDGMFYGCSGLTSLDVSNFDTGNVTSMYRMFGGCSGLTSLDVSSFDIGNVTFMEEMFSNCSGLTSLNVSRFDTGNVKGMSNMFYGCSSLTSLDLSSFDTGNVTSMGGMFEFCSNLTTIYCGENWNTDNVTSAGLMFFDCINLVGSAGTSYDISYDIEYAHVDGGTSNPGYLTLKTSIDIVPSDNTDMLDDNDGETKDVMLKFNIPSGKWITLCLPFDATAEQTQAALGDDVDIEELSTSAYDAETKMLTLNFTPCTAITAGRPYVVKVSETKNWPTFSGVTIDKTAPTTVNTTFCSMTGIFNATPLTAGDRNTLFIQNNQFYYPSTAGSLPATKCYFTLSLGASEARSIGMHFWDDEDVASGIYGTTTTKTEDNDAWYTPQGIRVSRPTKGLYIHNGKKVFVRNRK